ncbi:uncharacterized protein LOC136044498 [Cyrtonyx montezumae]|uniref:uncharacterized protein LOC136044498 n=1 Tax=Cyrtonyx montezumae TaxID=9017 RepID=UPI0032DB32D5
MEVVDGCRHTDPMISSNGYANRIFQADMEDRSADALEVCCAEHDTSSDAVPNEQEEAPRYKKLTKGNRIWNFVWRRKGSSMNKRRPRSMIVLGDTYEAFNEKRPSFKDRVMPLKKLRTSKLPKDVDSMGSAVQVTCVPEEDHPASGQRAAYRVKKLGDSQRPFRHSYGGHTEDLDSSFEDIELNISIPEIDTNESKCLRDISIRLHNEDNDSNCQKIPARKSESLNFENFKSPAITEGDNQKKCIVLPQEGKRGRSSDVWSYLKGISLTSKDNSKLLDERAETNFQNSENITDHSTSCLDFDMRREENLSQEKKANSPTKATHFVGFVRFFTSVAKAARRLRGSSKAFSPDEKSPQRSSRSWKRDVISSKVSLVIESDTANAFCAVGACLQSPDSGIWDNPSFESSVGKELTKGCKATEVPQDIGSSALSSKNYSYNETPLSPSVPELPDDSVTVINAKEPSETAVHFPQTTLTKHIQDLDSTPEKAQAVGRYLTLCEDLPGKNLGIYELGSSPAANGDSPVVTVALIHHPLKMALHELEPQDVSCSSVVSNDTSMSLAAVLGTELDMKDLRNPELPLQDLSRDDLEFQGSSNTPEKAQVIDGDLPCSQHHPAKTQDIAELDSSPGANRDFSAASTLKCATAEGQVFEQTDGCFRKHRTSSPVEQSPVELLGRGVHLDCGDECRPFQVTISRIVSSGLLNNRKV